MRKYNRVVEEFESIGCCIKQLNLKRLRDANLSGVDLRDADLSNTDLSNTDLSNAYLRNADLRDADLRDADLSNANLRDADLRDADLRDADLSNANLRNADLRDADLSNAYLRNADLRDADLRDANLRNADLRNANLSGVKNLLSSKEWLIHNFVKNRKGFIVYKAINHTDYAMPKHWIIKPNNFLKEEVNTLRTDLCGCGVNFGTEEYVRGKYPDSEIWKCQLHWIDLATLCVPYNTDGKARVGSLELLEVINEN